MANTLRIKRRAAGGAAGAPASLAAAELAYNEQDNTLYYGKGDVSGVASTVVAIAGPGAFVGVGALGANNGVATLDATGKLNLSQVPESLVGGMTYKGVMDGSSGLCSSGGAGVLIVGAQTWNKGWYYKVSVAGTHNINGNAYWQVGDMIVSNGYVWDRLEGGSSEVSTVFGRTGTVVMSADDVANATGQKALATGLLKNTTTTGAMSIAVAGTDYALPNANTTGTSGGLSGTPNIAVSTVAATTAAFTVPEYPVNATSVLGVNLQNAGLTKASRLNLTSDGGLSISKSISGIGWTDVAHFGGATGNSLVGYLRLDNQIISTVSMGTKPLVVTSDTMCDNLNANYVGGVNLSGLLQTTSSIDGGTF